MGNGGTERVAESVQETGAAEESASRQRPQDQSWKNEYSRALRWCGAAAGIGWLTQHLLDAAGVDESTIPKILLVVGAGLVVLAFVAVRKNPQRIGDLLVSNPLIVSVLSLITLATIAGTLIPQRIKPAAFDAAYGSAARIMRALHLDDLFHSLWLAGLVALMVTSLVAIAIKRWPWTFSKWGYVGAHLGPVVILFGAVYGQIGGLKGRMDLEVGRAADGILMQDWRTGEVSRAELPFAVRLDDFRIESHDPVYRVFVFERTGSHDENRSFEPVVSVSPLEEKGKRVAVDKRFSLQVESSSAGSESAVERHLLQLGGAELAVEPGKSYELGGMHVEVGAYFPHFTYDIPTKSARNVSDQPANPALSVEIRNGGPEGPVAYRGWLFANMPGFSMSGHGGEQQDVPVYRREGGSSGPTVDVSIFDGNEKRTTQTLTLQNGQHALPFADGRFVAVFRNRDNEAKNYHSRLSMIEGGKPVESREIFVNDPYTYGGYTFYQANYDPEHLRYSGIDVVRDPGLHFVYGGLVVMLLGVLHIFYLRTLGRRRKEVAT